MPHLRLEVPAEWLGEDFIAKTGFDARALLDHLVGVVAGLRMENPAIEARRREIRMERGEPDARVRDADARRDAAGRAIEPVELPLINLANLKHAIVPVLDAGVAGDHGKGFLHLRFSAGNEKPGRTAAVRSRVAETLGNEIDALVGGLNNLASVTVHVLDIDRERGYSTTASRQKRRGEA